MRVLFWAELFWPYIGGAELFAARLLSSLSARGHELTVVTSHDSLDLPDEDSYRGVAVHRFPFRRVLVPSHLEEMAIVRRRLRTVLRQCSPQLIHLNGVGPSAFFCLSAAPDVPLLVRVNREHAPVAPRGGGSTVLGHVLARAAWVTGVSEAALEQVRCVCPAISARSSVLYNGVESSEHPPSAPSIEPPHLLCLGRLVCDKGFDVVLEALPPLLARWPNLRVTVAGDGAERAALCDRARTLGLERAVDFVGWVAPEAVPSLIAASTLLLMPSRTDGLPAVALQAAAMGRPVIATRVGGIPEIVLHGETGLLVDLTPAGFTAAVTSLLERPDEVRRLGVAAWRRAREVFDEERCVDAVDRLYRRLGAPAA